MKVTVAALFVDSAGVYSEVPDVDCWGTERDARLYQGPHPVVAHPPCAKWCQLAYINQARYGHKVGDDGGCFAHALYAVRSWGGVLEHPAASLAWKKYQLAPPPRRGWQLCTDGDWVCEISQRPYGHRARKLTWLLYHGIAPPPELDWSRPEPIAQVSFCKNHGNSPLPRLSKREASATPLPFRDLLLDMARRAGRA